MSLLLAIVDSLPVLPLRIAAFPAIVLSLRRRTQAMS